MTDKKRTRRRKSDEVEDNPFQKAIKRIWKGLAAQTGRDEADVKYDLLLEMIEKGYLPAHKADQDTNILDTWSRGNVPPDWTILRFLAEVGYLRAKLPDSWVEEFLIAGNYPREAIGPILADLRAENAEIDRGLLHNLPQRDPSRFVGRQEEVAQLRRLLSPDSNSQAWVITVDGIGGVGKSELVLEVADQLRQEYARLRRHERFQAIVWVTAKETGLSDSGIITRVHRRTSSLDDIYTAIARVLGRLDILEADGPTRDDRIHEALAGTRTLLIIDNLESLKDETVLSFIREVPRPTKVVVTTRRRIDVAYAIRLIGLADNDAMTLIEREAALKGASLNEEERKRLLTLSKGVPIVINLVISRLALGLPFKTAVQYLEHPEYDLYRYALEDSVESLEPSEAAYHLLLALALCAGDASREALGTAAGLDGDEEQRDEVLVRLESLSLINRDAREDRFAMLPLTRFYLRSRLAADPELEQRLFQGLAAFYKRLFAADESANPDRYWQSIRGAAQAEALLEKEWATLRDLLFRLHEMSNYGDLLTLGLTLIHPLNFMGPFGDRLELCRRMAEAARVLNDPVEAWLLSDGMGWMFYRQGRYDEFFDVLNDGRLAAARYQGMELVPALADQHEAYVHIKQGNLRRARTLLDAVTRQLEAHRRENPTDQLGLLLGSRLADRWSSYYQALGEIEQASEMLKESVALRELSGEDQGSTHYNVGKLRLLSGDGDGARLAFTEALNYPHDRRYRTLARYGLAQVAAREENWPEALRQARQALARAEQLGLDEAAEVAAFLATLSEFE